jgi:hypothetical protein
VSVQSLSAAAELTIIPVARTPEKLTKVLEKEGITHSQISSQLTIVTGDIRSQSDVAKVLFPDDSNIPVDIVVSGIGAYPEIKWWGGISSKDPNLCEEAILVILSVLSSRSQGPKKPFVVTIGTTGISKLGRDNPWLMVPLYKGLLGEAHRDKEKMENAVVKAFEEQRIDGYTLVHASALTTGKLWGHEHVRSEIEGKQWSGKAIGYTISRKDVGNWIFMDVIKGFESVKGKGRIARITY